MYTTTRPSLGRRAILSALQALICAAVWTAAGERADAQGCQTFQETGGLLVVEVESAPTTGAWKSETGLAGFTGASYYRWDGPDLFGSPGQAILSYDFQIQTPGTYRLAVHNRHDDPDGSLENDAWLRVDGGSWVKCYSNSGGGVGAWIWDTNFEIGGSHLAADVPLDVGLHTLQFSARSRDFMIDRFHLALPGHPDAKNKYVPQSSCAGVGEARTYCVAKLNSLNCAPECAVPPGQPSLSATSGFPISASQIINGVPGLFLYGPKAASIPFLGGTLCVRPPFKRTPLQNSGGHGFAGSNCSGLLVFDMNAWMATSPDPLLAPGADVFGQFWYRDNGASFGSGLSDAAAMTIQP